MAIPACCLGKNAGKQLNFREISHTSPSLPSGLCQIPAYRRSISIPLSLAALRSCAPCFQTTAASDGSPPGGAAALVVEPHHRPAVRLQVGHDEPCAGEQLPQWNSTFATTRRAVFQMAAR
jgi:hypothetical protein